MAILDEYAGNPEQFPVLRRWNYLNHAGVAPWCRPVADAMRLCIDAFESNSYLGKVSYGEALRLKQSLGRFIGADVRELAILKNTAEAISTVALGLDWLPGDRVVTAAVEYPANVYPWMEAQRRFGIELELIPERDRHDGTRAIDVDELLTAASHPRCRLVALSHVQFGSGQRMPLERIGRWCRENRRLLCVDAIQALGALPLDVRTAHIDFLAAGSHKWMLGPGGASILYIRQELNDRIRPLAIGAYSVVDPDNYGDYRYEFQPDMRRHECGTLPMPAICGWRASVDLLAEVGMAAVTDRIRALTDRLADGLSSRRWRIVSPRRADEWSGIVSFVPTDPSLELEPLARRLRDGRNLELAVREHRLRASPHFYNTFEQIDALLEAVGDGSTK